MALALTIRDQTFGSDVSNEFLLNLPAETITAAELIKNRIYQEVREYNLKQKREPDSVFRGLVQPENTERTLNGFKFPRAKATEINWEQQYTLTLEAFKRNQIILLVNDKQVESQDEQIEISPDTVVCFLRLIPLVGG